MKTERLRICAGPWFGPCGMHPTITCSLFPGKVFCGFSWCKGECGLPALFYNDRKAHGEMVATGRVWQVKEWDGERVQIPEEHKSERVLNMWWQ